MQPPRAHLSRFEKHGAMEEARGRRAALGTALHTTLANTHQRAEALCSDAPATVKPTLAPPRATTQTAGNGR